MSFKIVIKEDAYQDLQIGYDYYEKEKNGLADEFVEEVKIN